jgi:hypothetical protein
MKAWHARTIISIAAISILASALVSMPATPASAEALVLFRSPEKIAASPDDNPANNRQRFRIKLDEKGDFMIQRGYARLVVAYNSPADQFKPEEQQRIPQRDVIAAINGISLTATLSF